MFEPSAVHTGKLSTFLIKNVPKVCQNQRGKYQSFDISIKFWWWVGTLRQTYVTQRL
ncbi:formate dehydrogenase-N, alpha subunit, partial [Neisseria shayeganii 871]